MSATINETLTLPKAGNTIRLVIGIALGVCVTAGLFWFMQYLIVTADRDLNEGSSGHLIDFVRLKRDESIQRRQLKPKKPPPPDAPPPQPPTPQLENLNPNAEKIAIQAAPVETDIEMSGGFSLAGTLPVDRIARWDGKGRLLEANPALLEALGFEVERHPVPEALVRDSGMIRATNLVVRRRFGDGPVIALNAHGDVVPPGEGWTKDPYGAEIDDGWMYGRGVAVSKSDFATYAYALLALEKAASAGAELGARDANLAVGSRHDVSKQHAPDDEEHHRRETVRRADDEDPARTKNAPGWGAARAPRGPAWPPAVDAADRPADATDPALPRSPSVPRSRRCPAC